MDVYEKKKTFRNVPDNTHQSHKTYVSEIKLVESIEAGGILGSSKNDEKRPTSSDALRRKPPSKGENSKNYSPRYGIDDAKTGDMNEFETDKKLKLPDVLEGAIVPLRDELKVLEMNKPGLTHDKLLLERTSIDDRINTSEPKRLSKKKHLPKMMKRRENIKPYSSADREEIGETAPKSRTPSKGQNLRESLLEDGMDNAGDPKSARPGYEEVYSVKNRKIPSEEKGAAVMLHDVETVHPIIYAVSFDDKQETTCEKESACLHDGETVHPIIYAADFNDKLKILIEEEVVGLPSRDEIKQFKSGKPGTYPDKIFPGHPSMDNRDDASEPKDSLLDAGKVRECSSFADEKTVHPIIHAAGVYGERRTLSGTEGTVTMKQHESPKPNTTSDKFSLGRLRIVATSRSRALKSKTPSKKDGMDSPKKPKREKPFTRVSDKRKNCSLEKM
ncbi:hypothetical protein Ciccas_011434 [Cichlidogyrus casuarinus]|uniref:Uncharacterized protein n=1 Tax=Cichlidogyrus casuarinus TaxID=1844966 RepID=A0ABD2PSI3_9PLAT